MTRRFNRQFVNDKAETASPRPWRLCDRRLACLVALVLVAGTAAVYAPVRHFGFVTYDDLDFLVRNPAVASGLNWESVRWAFHHPYTFTGGPLTWLSHMLDMDAFGLDAGAHHLTSLFIHLLNTILLFTLLRRTTNSLPGSGFVAALFALHPLHVESVAWISQRKDVLSTLFWLAALHAYTSYVGRPRVKVYLAVLSLHLMGLMAKPMVATLPFTLLLFDIWPLHRITVTSSQWRRAVELIVEKLPLVAFSILSLWLTLGAQQQLGAVSDFEAVPLADRLGNAMVSYAAYVFKVLWPSDLTVYYPYRDAIRPVTIVASLLACSLLTATALASLRRFPVLFVGWMWFAGTLVPVIGLVQVGGHAMADRYTYVPAIGLFVVFYWSVAALVNRWSVPRAIPLVASAAMLVAVTVTARAQVWTWQNGVTLWRHAISVSSPNARAHANLGASLAEAGRVAEAIETYRIALALEEGSPRIHRNLALALIKSGDLAGARKELEDALRLAPDYAAAEASLADVLAARADIEGALRHYLRATELDPNAGLTRINLAMTLAQQGRLVEAVPHAQEAVRLEPLRWDWRFALALLLKDVGRLQEAARELESVIASNPGHAEAKRELASLR